MKKQITFLSIAWVLLLLGSQVNAQGSNNNQSNYYLHGIVIKNVHSNQYWLMTDIKDPATNFQKNIKNQISSKSIHLEQWVNRHVIIMGMSQKGFGFNDLHKNYT